MIEPKDILALEYECHSCHAKYSIRMDSPNARPQTKCPGCGETWVRMDQLADRVDLVDTVTPHFIRYLGALRNLATKSTLRLEVAMPPEDVSRVPAE